MTLPTYDQFIGPLLRYLAQHPDGASTKDVYRSIADAMQLTDEQRLQLLPSGQQPVFKNRIGWAHDRLKRHGLSFSPRRGYWQLTDRGAAYVRQNPGELAEAEVERLATVANDSRLRAIEGDETVPAAPASPISESPDDRLAHALAELQQSVAAEVLELINQATPSFFEVLVLDLLHAMGYGTSRTDLQRVGGSGDAGIDGIISLDRLGLEKVYVQAKRWQSQSVSRPDVQAFYGALAGQRANKGVFITTSTFTAQAVDFARSVERIVLVDGERLAELMIEHGVGVTHRIIKVPKVDSDYFED